MFEVKVNLLRVFLYILGIIIPGAVFSGFFKKALKKNRYIFFEALLWTLPLILINYWAYYLNNYLFFKVGKDFDLGEGVTIFIYSFSLIGPFFSRSRENLKNLFTSKLFWLPMVLILISAHLYGSLQNMYKIKKQTEPIQARFFSIEHGSPDYFIQQIHGERKLKQRKPIWAPKPATDWYRSTLNERPPFSAALYLFLRGLKVPEGKLKKRYYQIAYALQLLFIPALFLIFTYFFDLKISTLLTSVFTFSAYATYGVLYPTGKLLAGSLALVGLCFLFEELIEKKQTQRINVLKSSVFLSIAAFIHSGTALFYPPLAIFLIYLWSKGRFQFLDFIFASFIFVLVFFPYQILLSLNEPWPAGATRFLIADERNREIYENLNLSNFQAALESYKALGWKGVLERKWEYLTSYLLFSWEDIISLKSLKVLFGYLYQRSMRSWSFSFLLTWPLLIYLIFKSKKLGENWPLFLTTLFCCSLAFLFFFSFSGALSSSIVPSVIIMGFFLSLSLCVKEEDLLKIKLLAILNLAYFCLTVLAYVPDLESVLVTRNLVQTLVFMGLFLIAPYIFEWCVLWKEKILRPSS